MGATNLIPGPNSTELAIHLGWDRARWKGLLPFLEGDFVDRLGWITQQQPVDAVSIGQVTPGADPAQQRLVHRRGSAGRSGGRNHRLTGNVWTSAWL